MSGPVAELRDVEAERHLVTLSVLHAALAVFLLLLASLLARSSPIAAVGLAGAAAVVFWIARGLPRRRTTARAAALVLAGGSLPLLPVGTAFGAYAFRVLLSERGRALFLRPRLQPGVRPFAAILVAQVSLAACVLGGALVCYRVALPMLADAHRARLEAEAASGVGP